MEKNKPTSIFKTSIFKLCLILCTPFIIISLFQVYFYEYLFFIFIPVYLLLIFLLLGLFYSLFFAVKNFKHYKLKSLIPSYLYTAAIVIYFLNPLRPLIINIDYFSNLTQRNEIIEEIRENKFKTRKVNDNITSMYLPENKNNLSAGGGEVMVAKTYDNKIRAFFYTERGILDSGSSGFLYTDIPNEPGIESYWFEPIKIVQKSPNWYWISY